MIGISAALVAAFPEFEPADRCAANVVGAVAAAILMHELCEDPCQKKDHLNCDIANAIITSCAACLQGIFVGGLGDGITKDFTDGVSSIVGGVVGAEMDQCKGIPGG